MMMMTMKRKMKVRVSAGDEDVNRDDGELHHAGAERQAHDDHQLAARHVQQGAAATLHKDIYLVLSSNAK